MPERGILCFKSDLGLEKRGNQVQKKKYQRGIATDVKRVCHPDHPRLYWKRDCTPGTEWFRFQKAVPWPNSRSLIRPEWKSALIA
jgi:hypothetical protein